MPGELVWFILESMPNAILALATAAMSAALTVLVTRAVRVAAPIIASAPPVPYPVPTPESADELLKIRADMDRLKLAVSEGIARVDRSEKRIQKTVTSARRMVRDSGLEHAGIEAEFAELESPDAEADESLPPVQEQMGATRVVRFPGGQREVLA